MDCQGRVGRVAHIVDGLPQIVEGFGNLRRKFLPGLGQRDLPRLSDEERLADILLQQFHLIAHRRLGHAQLFAGLGEAQMPCGSFEHPQGVQGKLAGHFHG